MRKIGHLPGMLLALGLCACQNLLEEDLLQDARMHPGETILKATIESGSPTRTSLSSEGNGVNKVLWSEGDVIGVFVDDAADASVFRLVDGAGTRNGVFSGFGQGSKYVAAYPFGQIRSLEGDVLTFDLPVEQAYADGNVGAGALPMVAVGVSTDLSFRNVASVLKLSLKGHQLVTRLVFRPKDPSIKVSGPMSVSLARPDDPVVTMSPDGVDSVAVNTGSVLLDKEKETIFFIGLPAQTYKGGFTVRIYTSTGYMDKTYGADFTMERSKVHAAGTVTVRLDSGVEVSESLEGQGTEKDPLRIASLGDLLLMQTSVNAGQTIRTSVGGQVEAAMASYILVQDIDLGGLYNENTGKSWTPIGDYSNLFRGTFDGGGHAVTRLYIHGDEDCRGLFGAVEGATIRNLTVSGDVTAHGYCGVLAGDMGRKTTVDGVVTKGTVKGENHVGGLMGHAYHVTMTFCRNEADLRDCEYYCGGLVGLTEFSWIQHCTNRGKVDGNQLSGGLAGYLNGSRIVDCTNTGDVTGRWRIGGLGGYFWQGGKILNSINYGNVKGLQGSQYVGGLGGFVSSRAISYQQEAIIANCIHLGTVEITDGTYCGWLAGFIGLADGETPIGDEPASGAWVKNCYWLQDGPISLPEVGGGPGIAENNFALTEAQLKGDPYPGTLYVAPDGTGFNLLIDALNAGAVYWGNVWENGFGSGWEGNPPLSGWVYPGPGSYPALTDLEAQMPGNSKPIFRISADSFEMDAVGGTFQVEVTSSQDYTVSQLPEWITEVSSESPVHQPHTRIFTYSVAVNRSASERKESITFTNASGTVLTVKLTQKAPYLTISVTELLFPDAGGSKRIPVSSSVAWKVTSEADWFSVTPASGTGDGALSVLAEANGNASARGGSIVLSAVDFPYEYVINLVQSGYAGEETGDWKQLPFVHQSVAMRFTATWCGWCPYMNRSILRAQELYPGKIQHLALHGGGSDLQFDPTGTLMSLFRTNAFPTGVMDGRIKVNNSTDIESVAANFIEASKQTEQTYGTVSGLALRSVSSGQQVTIDVDGYFKQAGDYKITVLLVEDGIIHPQENGGDDYVHDNVVRVTATGILGDAFTVGSDFTQKSFHYSVTVPSGYRIENMRVLAYVQKSFGTAPVIQTEDYGNYYIDNCATAPVGAVLKLALEGGGGGGGTGGGDNEGITPGDDINL